MKEFFWTSYEWYCYTFEEKWFTIFKEIYRRNFNKEDGFIKILEIRKTFENTVNSLDDLDLDFYVALFNSQGYYEVGKKRRMMKILKIKSDRQLRRRKVRFYRNFYNIFRKENPELCKEIKSKLFLMSEIRT